MNIFVETKPYFTSSSFWAVFFAQNCFNSSDIFDCICDTENILYLILGIPMNNTLTKAQIIDAVHDKTDRTRGEARKYVESLLAIMKNAIKRDNALLISGFGKFEAYAKKARRGRNPATDKQITLEARKVIVFRLSKKFRAELN
jgi:integration host factor subunit alpha